MAEKGPDRFYVWPALAHQKEWFLIYKIISGDEKNAPLLEVSLYPALTVSKSPS
ncbi:hypothetical protein [Bacillus sp. BP-3]|uniref:hypothetical protein n=1 Tax=Bacillus sp. BP-3 TaxID=3022773 RepID=UPI00232B7BC8|nr:hypothetical protein [Bacillus sp. BP-3]